MKNLNLTDKHLSEATSLNTAQKQELENLYSRHLSERQEKGISVQLNLRHEQEEKALLQKHTAEQKILTEQQVREFQDSETLRKKIEPIESDSIERSRIAINIQYTEEREKTRLNAKDYQSERQSLIDKLKDRWSKDHDKDLDH